MNPYVIIHRHGYDNYNFLTVKVPELYSDKCWKVTPNYGPKFDKSDWYVKEFSYFSEKVFYPKQFAHLTLLEYMQTYHPEHLI